MMWRKILFTVSFIALFMPARFVSAQTARGPLAFEVESSKTSGVLPSVRFVPLLPLDQVGPVAGSPVDFSWSPLAAADRYHLEVAEANGKVILSLLLSHSVGSHRVPSSQLDARENLRWRVVALDSADKQIEATPWRTLLPPISICEIL